MKIIFVLLVSFLEANPCITDVLHITPEKHFSGKDSITIQQGTPLIEQQDPRIAFGEKQWIASNEKISCPQACINHYFTDTRSGSFDHHSGHRPVSQLSGFVQRRPQANRGRNAYCEICW